jgi:hypothetical protein
MWANRTVTVAAAGVLAALALAGCKDEAKSLSNSGYLLKLQHEAWQNTRETLQSENPRLTMLHSVHVLLTRRTPRRVEKGYNGPDKEQLLAKLRSLASKYESEVASKVDMSGNEVRLRAGVTLEQVREAFMNLDPEYRELEAMTGWER